MAGEYKREAQKQKRERRGEVEGGIGSVQLKCEVKVEMGIRRSKQREVHRKGGGKDRTRNLPKVGLNSGQYWSK